MASTTTIAVWIAVLALLIKPLRGLYRTFVGPFFSPLRNVPGPSPQNWVYGNIKESRKLTRAVAQRQWMQQYGSIFTTWSFFGSQRLFLGDSRGIGHVISDPMNYYKPQLGRYIAGQIIGDGILTVEGAEHKHQRRVLNPAFGIAQIRELLPVFLEKSSQLRDVWRSRIAENGSSRIVVDILDGLQLTTLDIIGLAGFGFNFNALNPPDDSETRDFTDALRVLTNGKAPGLMTVLQGILPPLRVIPTPRTRRIAKARAVLNRIGGKLIDDRKRLVLGDFSQEKIKRDDVQGKDILSLLVRANLATDLPEKSRLSDEDMLSQIPTLLVAGHETTSSAVTWGLHSLSNNQTIQDKLRAELRECIDAHGSAPSVEALNSLVYLDMFVREVMRLHAPVSSTLRVAMKDDLIPTDHEWIDVHGVKHSGVPVAVGDTVFLPIEMLNTSTSIWGEDATDFRPERWEHPPNAAQSIPGVWGNSLSFLGGPRACIGFRFSLLEMKALFFTLVSTLRFENALDPENIVRRSMVVTRPFIKDEEGKGAQLPMYVSLAGDE
ncbi:cytochrome P450 [Peniophora sp. CONT]|nr:cytochrome P450 [Peniophora sp. CONT]